MDKDENLKWLESKLKEMGFGELLVDLGSGKRAILSVAENDKADDQNLRHCFKHIGVQETIRYAEMINHMHADQMKMIYKSIDRLSKVLLDRGYKGPYNIEGFHTEIIPDLLIKYWDTAIQNPMKIHFPFVASTYTKYNHDDTGYIRCFIMIDFIEKKGLEITHMKAISCDRDHKVLEEWKKPISSSLEIPVKEQLNKKVLPKVHQHKKKKGPKH